MSVLITAFAFIGVAVTIAGIALGSAYLAEWVAHKRGWGK